MKKYFLILSLDLACLLTNSVFANGKAHILYQPASNVVSGWVIGADVGWGYLDTPKDNLAFADVYTEFKNLSQSHDLDDLVWGVHGGRTFDITPSILLGFEAGYKDLGKSKYKSTGKWDDVDFTFSRKVDQQAVDVLLTSNYFVWQGLNLFAKAGIAYVGSTTRQTFDTISLPPETLAYYNTKKSIWRFRPEVILGMGYMFNNIDFHVLYDHILGVSEIKWGDWGGDYWEGSYPPVSPRPRIYGTNLVMGGISYVFTDINPCIMHRSILCACGKPGWVVGANVGWGYLDAPEDNLAFGDNDYYHIPDLTHLSQSHDIGDIVWGVHGGRTFSITYNMLLGFDVGYKDLGRSKYKSTGKWNGSYISPFYLSRKVDQQAIDILLTCNYFVWQGLNLFAKAGMAYVGSTTKQTFDIMYESLPYNAKKSIWELRPELIFGMGYMFNNHIDVHLLYDYIYGVSETKWNKYGDDYWNGKYGPIPPKPRTYGANLVMGGISYTF
ncbi:MAG: hypothetical protein AMJ43_03700 [Coxiella sp. DG_40]|nr:MAG: hypothetical protein AMJ43_03700 [Coxiella sp. DG_40]